MKPKLATMFPVLLLSAAGTIASVPAHAVDIFTSDSKVCPQGFGCIYAVTPGTDTRSQGVDFPAGVYRFEQLPVNRPANLSQIRNRNVTTRRSVVVLLQPGNCFALRYDDRFWVTVPVRAGGPGLHARSMKLTNLSRPPGSTTNVSGCSSTRWI